MSLASQVGLLATRIAAEIKTRTTPVVGTLTGSYTYSTTTVTRTGKIVTLNAVVLCSTGPAAGAVIATTNEAALRPAAHCYWNWSVVNSSGVAIGWATLEFTTDGKWNLNAVSTAVPNGGYLVGGATYPGA